MEENEKLEQRDYEYSMIDLTKGDNDAESILSTIAYIILGLGLLSSVILGLWIGGKDGWTVFIVMAASSAIIWAGSMILINISNNLRNIKYLLARAQGLSVSEGFDPTAPIPTTTGETPTNDTANTPNNRNVTSKSEKDDGKRNMIIVFAILWLIVGILLCLVLTR